MYSTSMKPKVDTLFEELIKKSHAIVNEAATYSEAVDRVTKLAGSELAARSKTILSDMLFELSDSVMETDFFTDVVRQNQFIEANLRQEVLNKYQFAPDVTMDYKEASRTIRALETGGAAFALIGLAEVGTVLMKRLSFSSLVPVPVSLLIIASIGAAMADYYVVEPKRSRKATKAALETYFVQMKQQFLTWFDEIETYFNKRVEEIKQTIRGDAYESE